MPLARNALVQAALALFIGDHLAVDQNLAEGFMKQVRTAFDRHTFLEDNDFGDRLARKLQDGRAPSHSHGVKQHRKGDLGQIPFGHSSDGLELFGSRDHPCLPLSKNVQKMPANVRVRSSSDLGRC